jgi:hydroxymethylbilane synthase
MHIKIGTRKSPLALAQAEEVAGLLAAHWPETTTELVKITTSGDRFLDRPLADIGGKGLFTKEIEEALLAGDIDIAVHSMKDMPTQLPAGLTIGCLLPREDARDMLIGDGLSSLAALPAGLRIGTSSMRRALQIQQLRPDVKVVPFRGNVQTRIEKLRQGKADATLLAMAGLNRLGIMDAPGFVLEPRECLPAVAQGAIGIECREEDSATLGLLEPLNDPATAIAVACERAMLAALDGSCRTPIAGYATLNGAEITLEGWVAQPDGTCPRRAKASAHLREAIALGQQVAAKLLGAS